MIKQIQVVFDFNTETEEVSNVKVVGSSEKKKTTTKKAKDIVTEIESESIITLEANKLVFNSKALADLNAESGDRLIIKWVTEGKKMLPVIEKSEDDENGNKLTKSNTIAYKGKANTVLAEKGSEFTLSPYKGNVFKLVPTSEPSIDDTTLEEAIEKAELINPDLIVSSDEDQEIELMKFSL